MISFPWPICLATASSPSSRARFFELMISVAVFWMTSVISRISWSVFHGIRPRMKRRNFGVPILRSGVRYIWRNAVLKARGLKICLVREISDVHWQSVHKFLDRFAKDMIVSILGQRLKRVPKTTLANELEGSPGHPQWYIDLIENCHEEIYAGMTFTNLLWTILHFSSEDVSKLACGWCRFDKVRWRRTL